MTGVYICWDIRSGRELSGDEKNYLQSITNEGTIKSCIQFLAAQRLLLEELDATDATIVKLGLSRIVNAINPTIRNLIYSNLNDDEKQVFVMKSAGLPCTGLEPDKIWMNCWNKFKQRRLSAVKTSNEMHSCMKL
ncbi:hypothetical protein BDF21DRAFT_24185 [Thamnidium elegans]|nr:hypothetical protein BDF21DRAFT_24185 [Thamnidium elegans]